MTLVGHIVSYLLPDASPAAPPFTGIYELKDKEFRVAFAPPGKPRPAKFATAPDSGQWMHVWKHMKE